MALELGHGKPRAVMAARFIPAVRYATDWHAATFLIRLRWRALRRSLDRRHLRNNEIALTVLAGFLGLAVGAAVSGLREGEQLLHQLVFRITPDHLLSEGVGLIWWTVLAVPPAGGLLVGIATWVIRKLRPREVVDAIEANALYGGKMSLVDSANLALLTLLSGGAGASVGLEAAYTQLGAGFTSNVGEFLRVRRDDLRTLVGAGAAAAIAAAFDAPLAGAFYAFELVIGSYATSVLAPVTVAALAGTAITRWTQGSEPLFYVSEAMQVHGRDYAIFVLLGAIAAGISIATMVSVTWIERKVRQWGVPVWLRPAFGGLGVGLIAFFAPQVLGSGHGAVQEIIEGKVPLLFLLLLIPAKAIASAISVGAGFRGGLFSSSLFLGALFGAAAGGVVQHMIPGHPIDQLAYTVVGMGTIAAAIVGAPVTMILLILELTANFYASVGVMTGVIVASLIVRAGFGYSFATWRFHVRGLSLRGAADIGWIHDLTVSKLMRRDPQTVSAETPLAALRQLLPLGGNPRAFLIDKEGNYDGMVLTADVHNHDLDDKLETMKAGDLRRGQTCFLLPHENVKIALGRFQQTELEALPVLASANVHRVVGYLTEAYALRRYSQELERARASDLGDSALFGPA